MSDNTVMDPLNLTDEELDNLTPDQIEAFTGASPILEETEEEENSQEDIEEIPVVDPNADLEHNKDIDADEEEDESAEVIEEDDEEESGESVDEADEEEGSPFSDDETEEDSRESEEVSQEEPVDTVDFEKEHKRLLAPFKANGKEIKVNNVDEAITLMQMGANYSKKMAGLKPSLKLIKMLEQNELLDESKLSYLIDLNKGNPDAVAKLVKDSKVDPLDIDTEGESKYTPGNYTVSDSQVELENVLDGIKDSPDYQRTIEVVATQWDSASKSILTENPNIITAINEQMGNGVYDQISNEVERVRLLGGLVGVSDIQAYKQIGDQLQREGKFGNPTQEPARPVKKVAIKPKGKKVETNSTVAKKRKAAGTVKSKKSAAKPQYNPLSMSDEEFEKISGLNV